MDGVNWLEIDTSSPFGSVKEAISLFGERVLAGEVYADKAKEVQSSKNGNLKIGEITAELEETKQSLEKAREEGTLMANSLTLLQEELDRTKKEQQMLKKQESRRQEKETEDVKFIEPPGTFKTTNENEAEFQKRSYVSFASLPMLEQTVVPRYKESPPHKHPPLDKKKKLNKKKTLLPLIGGLLHKKKQGDEVASISTAARDWY